MYEADQYFINNVTDIWLTVVLPEDHYNKIDSAISRVERTFNTDI